MHQTYQQLCGRGHIRALTLRAFSDLISELEMYSFLNCSVTSRGRYGRTRDIRSNIPESVQMKWQYCCADKSG